MKTLADFKRAMTVGSVWLATHQYIGENPSPQKDLGTRECTHVQSNSFAFNSPSGNLSWCDWPKASELSFIGDIAVITKPGFVKLTYRKV